MDRRMRTDFWRLFDPRYVLALEKQRRGDMRAIDSFVGSIGRQAPAGSETEMRAANVILLGRVHALETAAGVAVVYLDSGRTEAAREVLTAILDTDPVNQREAS